ncbi:MAG: UPF0262 family protein [Rhodobacteraceae bacterium]|nr:UPF0262 family protein [Paracoccaceae bacterium]
MSSFAPTDRLGALDIEALSGAAPSPEVAQERKVAVFDLLEDNSFRLVPRDDRPAPPGPYHLKLAEADRKLVFEISTEADGLVTSFHLSMTPFRRLMSEYFAVCDSYYDAIKTLPASQIEAIDMGRRGLHNDASELLQERLDGKVETDKDTARRLFTLICALRDRSLEGG